MTINDKIRLLDQVRKLSESDWNEFKDFLLRHSTDTAVQVEDYNKLIGQELQNLGISLNRKGYYYLRFAINYYMQSKNPIRISITKELYPTVAKHFQTTPTCVEKSIRDAIKKSDCYKMTNSAFIATLYNRLNN